MRALLVTALVLAGCVREAPIEGAACNLEHRCPGGFACAGGACRRLDDRPIARCGGDRECTVGVCLESAGFCVQCQGDDDCEQGVCLPGLYVCGCHEHGQCLTGRCNLDSGMCVSCFAPEQCQSGRCDVAEGVCDRIEPGSKGDAGAGGTQ